MGSNGFWFGVVMASDDARRAKAGVGRSAAVNSFAHLAAVAGIPKRRDRDLGRRLRRNTVPVTAGRSACGDRKHGDQLDLLTRGQQSVGAAGRLDEIGAHRCCSRSLRR